MHVQYMWDIREGYYAGREDKCLLSCYLSCYKRIVLFPVSLSFPKMYWKWCLIPMCSHRHWYIVQGDQGNVTRPDAEWFTACIVLHNAPCYWHVDLMENSVHLLLDRMESVHTLNVSDDLAQSIISSEIVCIVYNTDILLITCAHSFTELYHYFAHKDETLIFYKLSYMCHE